MYDEPIGVMFNVYDEPESPKEAGKIYGEQESSNEGAVFKIYEEPLPPNEGACSRYMMNRNHQVRGQHV